MESIIPETPPATTITSGYPAPEVVPTPPSGRKIKIILAYGGIILLVIIVALVAFLVFTKMSQ